MATETKVTYATLSADDAEMHKQFDAGITKARAALGRTTPLYIGGEARATTATTATTSPADTRVVVANVAAGTAEDVNDAMKAARAAFPA
ncbi:MAG TPA: aldehyde dehydrogenase, partial [Polyangia bacterium]